MSTDYDTLLREKVNEVFAIMEPRTDAAGMDRMRRAFNLAREAHATQRRKEGEPYIFHPVAVAKIVARRHASTPTPCRRHSPTWWKTPPHARGDTLALRLRRRASGRRRDKAPQGNIRILWQIDNYRHMLEALNTTSAPCW